MKNFLLLIQNETFWYAKIQGNKFFNSNALANFSPPCHIEQFVLPVGLNPFSTPYYFLKGNRGPLLPNFIMRLWSCLGSIKVRNYLYRIKSGSLYCLFWRLEHLLWYILILYTNQMKFVHKWHPDGLSNSDNPKNFSL